MRNVVIAGAVRTPIGGFNGSLSTIQATTLGALVIREALSRAGIEKEQVDEVIMGNVLPHGLGQNPGRQAAIRPRCPGRWVALRSTRSAGPA